jgi:hypothetical protein
MTGRTLVLLAILLLPNGKKALEAKQFEEAVKDLEEVLRLQDDTEVRELLQQAQKARDEARKAAYDQSMHRGSQALKTQDSLAAVAPEGAGSQEEERLVGSQSEPGQNAAVVEELPLGGDGVPGRPLRHPRRPGSAAIASAGPAEQALTGILWATPPGWS